jgi:threonine synthase
MKYTKSGIVKPKDRVVVVSTAHGLKFSETKAAYHTNTLKGVTSTYANPPVELAADRQSVYDAVMRHMERTFG